MEARLGRLPGFEAIRAHMESSAPCPAAAPLVKRQFHVLVGVTGSVAALKLPLLVSRLLDIPDVSMLTRQRGSLMVESCRSWGQPIFTQCTGCLVNGGVCGSPLCALVCRGSRRQCSITGS